MYSDFKIAVVVSTVTVGIYAALLFALDGFSREAASDLGLVALPLFAFGTCAWRASKSSAPYRLGWLLIALSTLSWAIGEAIWSYYELALRIEVPFPSLADLGYLAAVPLAGAGLLSLPATRTGARVRAAFDGLIIASALLCTSWLLVIGPLYSDRSESIVETVIGLSYPLGDVALITLVLITALNSRHGMRRPLLFLGAGLVAFSVADSAFAYLTLNELYFSGHPIDIAWGIGYALMAIAPFSVGQEDTASDPDDFKAEGLGSILLPYIPVGIGLVAIAAKVINGGNIDPFAITMGLITFLLVIARQILRLSPTL